MGEHSHICTEFDQVVSCVLENYEVSPLRNSENHDVDETIEDSWVQEILSNDGALPSQVDNFCISWKDISNEKGELNITMEQAASPSFWSRVCVDNMSKLAKEATTLRRVLESLFRYFDDGNSWSPNSGLALYVLSELQQSIENSGENSHMLLSILIKHLDHKEVQKDPQRQLCVAQVSTCLAGRSKAQASITTIGAINDLMRLMRRSMQSSLEQCLQDDAIKWSNKFRAAIDESLVQMSNKNSIQASLVRSFQLALSLRSIALEGDSLKASHRRSLFTLATSMILFASTAFNIHPLLSGLKDMLTNKYVNPYLHLVEDCRLQVADAISNCPSTAYGSKEEEDDAFKFLSAIQLTGNLSTQALITEIVNSLENVSDSKLNAIRSHLQYQFLPDDDCPSGTEILERRRQVASFDCKSYEPGEKVPGSISFIDVNALVEAHDNQHDSRKQISIETNLLDVNELLESVHETTKHVERVSVSAPIDISFKEMTGNCEAVMMGKQQKMCVFMNEQKQDMLAIAKEEVESAFTHSDQRQQPGSPFPQQMHKLKLHSPCQTNCAKEYQIQLQGLKLPASSPYDNFLKAAGC